MGASLTCRTQVFGDLADLLQTAKQWDVYKARLMCLKGALAHATGNLEYAASCFRGSLHLCQTSAPRSLSLQDEVAVLSKASYVLVKVASGVRLRTRAKEGAKMSAKRQRDEDEEAVEELEAMVQELKAEAATASPMGQLAAQVVDALTCGEIVRSKSVPPWTQRAAAMLTVRRL